MIACGGNGGGDGHRRVVVGRAGDRVVIVDAGWGRRWSLDTLGMVVRMGVVRRVVIHVIDRSGDGHRCR